MNYHEQIINRSGCVCRPWLPADMAQVEITKLRVLIEEQSSLIESLRWNCDQKEQLIAAATAKIADLEKELAEFKATWTPSFCLA